MTEMNCIDSGALNNDVHGQQVKQATDFALTLARKWDGVDVTNLRNDYLDALEDFQALLVEFQDALGTHSRKDEINE